MSGSMLFSRKLRRFKQGQSVDKVMANMFWGQKGVLFVDFMAGGTTINAVKYCETVKKPLIGSSKPEKMNSEQEYMPFPKQRSLSCGLYDRRSPARIWMRRHHPPTHPIIRT